MGDGGSELYGLELKLESCRALLVYGEPEGSLGKSHLGYEHEGGRGGVSDFTSNFRRSKSLRYSMARGLGGREGMGREGEDMISAAGLVGATQEVRELLRETARPLVPDLVPSVLKRQAAE